MAFEKNLDLSLGENEIASAAVNLKESKFSRLPNLNLNSSGSYFSGRAIDPTTNDFITENFLSNDVSLSSGVMIYNGGRINQQIKQDKINQKIADSRYEMTRDNIGLLVINQFLNIVLSQENLDNQKNLLQLSQDQNTRLKNQVDAGSRPRNELLNLEVQIAQDQQSVVQLENELALNKIQLAQSIRWEGDPNYTLVSPPIENITGESMDQYSFDVVYAAALKTMPSIAVAELSKKRAEGQIKLAKSGYMPTLSGSLFLNTRYSDAAQTFDFETEWTPFPLRIDGQLSNAEIARLIPTNGKKIGLIDQWDQNLGYGVGLNLSVPIFSRWANTANVQRAKIQDENADIEITRATDNLKMDIQNALASARAARANFEAASRTLDLSKNAFENNSKAYDIGSTNSFELNQSRINFENAQRSVVSSKYNYLFRIKVLDFYLGRKINF